MDVALTSDDSTHNRITVAVPCVQGRTSEGLFVIGLDLENLVAVRAGRPLLLALKDMGAPDDVLVFYGTGMAQIRKLILDTLGAELPLAPHELKPN